MSATRKVVETAPERIWLQIADDAYYADEPFPEPASDQITWCSESVMEVEVKYVRADLVSALLEAVANYRELPTALNAEQVDAAVARCGGAA
jgi:hypothetical protein